jgi:hypothetical protein
MNLGDEMPQCCRIWTVNAQRKPSTAQAAVAKRLKVSEKGRLFSVVGEDKGAELAGGSHGSNSRNAVRRLFY